MIMSNGLDGAVELLINERRDLNSMNATGLHLVLEKYDDQPRSG